VFDSDPGHDHDIDESLFSTIPALIRNLTLKADDSGQERAADGPGAPQVGVVVPKREVPEDLRQEWELHRRRLQTLELEIPPNVQLVSRSEVDGGIRVWIPSGRFTMGSNNGDKNEKPARTFCVESFHLDICPITNGQFARFIRATGYAKGWKPQSDSDHPMIRVSWDDARAYCEWAGKRLPAEAEWERAARGIDSRTYPWGSEFDSHRANALENGYSGTSPVGSFPTGASPFGVLDMAGNVWEWVDDRYHVPHTHGDVSQSATQPERRVLRGGAWICHPRYLRCAKREHQLQDYRSKFAGFRCAS
jgi:formylglycine-generating enzyme required for sulfatase activity